MRIQKRIFFISIILAFVTFVVSVYLHCHANLTRDYWNNVCLAVFGSATISLVTSVITYQYEKGKALRSFYNQTKRLVDFLSKYPLNTEKLDPITYSASPKDDYEADDKDIEELYKKTVYLVDYLCMDLDAWEASFVEIDFLFEKIHKKREWILANIFTPINNFNNRLKWMGFVHDVEFRKSHPKAKSPSWPRRVAEIERQLFDIQYGGIPGIKDKNGIPAVGFAIKRKLCETITGKLEGQFLTMMMGKKAIDEMHSKNEEWRKELKEGDFLFTKDC